MTCLRKQGRADLRTARLCGQGHCVVGRRTSELGGCLSGTFWLETGGSGPGGVWAYDVVIPANAGPAVIGQALLTVLEAPPLHDV
jgi:hypothetical protein